MEKRNPKITVWRNECVEGLDHTVLTPLGIEIMLKAYYHGGGYILERGISPPAYWSVLNTLEGAGLVKRLPSKPHQVIIMSTRKGNVYVRHGLCRVPFPVEVAEIVIPWKEVQA